MTLDVKRWAYFAKWLDQAAWNQHPDADPDDFTKFSEHPSYEAAKEAARLLSIEHGEAEAYRRDLHTYDYDPMKVFFRNGEEVSGPEPF